ncbi:MAG: dodecin family protein [Actinomycetota bacterium]
MPVYNSIELVGVSTESWGDAAREALREASKTIRNIRSMTVLDTSCVVSQDKITEFRTSVRLQFEIESRR